MMNPRAGAIAATLQELPNEGEIRQTCLEHEIAGMRQKGVKMPGSFFPGNMRVIFVRDVFLDFCQMEKKTPFRAE